ncbi:MAG: response regulator [Verrucomicrobiota bacterium]|jgi:PAS domain S-box-containing protein
MDPATMPAANRVLIIDDNVTIHADFRKILAAPEAADDQLRKAESLLFGEATEPAPFQVPLYRIDSASQGQEGLRLVEQATKDGCPYALAFVDVRMPPGWDGIETVDRIWKLDPDLPVVICTAYSDYSWPDMMARLGHSDNLVVLRKPFEAVEVLQLAHSLTRKWLLARQLRAHLKEMDALVAQRTRSLQETNQALQSSEERFAKAFRNNPVPLLLSDASEGRCVDVNDSFLALTGFKREEVLARTPEALEMFVRPEIWHQIREDVSAQRPVDGRQLELRTHDGKTVTALVSAEPLDLQNRPHLLMSLQDVTERINIENQLRQAQKMEAVGQIAAGIAHDFNNILGVIQGHAELQLNVGHRDESLLESLQEIANAANRAASLTRQLLAFSRKQMLRPRALDVSEVLANLDKMLQRIIGENIQLHIQCAESLPPVLADQVNLEQVVINLAVNARDAMPRGGPLTIRAELAVVDASHKQLQPDAIPGTFVKLSVADAGVGMDQNVRRKIFEPFFTTKAVGKGTGMGLATVYGIVKQHQGWIEVESTLGAGTVFMVYLPPAHGPVKKSFESGTDLIKATVTKPRTILIVEDEPALRGMAEKILKRLGYNVVTARDGPDALEIWPQMQGKIDLLFTDMMMPGGLTGRELAERLLHDQPGLPVVYSTGYSVDFVNPDVKLIEGVNFLFKPYDATALTRIVKKALGGTG